jgi:signal peptidase
MHKATMNWRRPLRIASTAVVGAALVVACLALLLLGIGPLTQQYRLLTVQSGSMAPTMPVGSVVVVTPQPLSSVRVGDIITFQMPTNPDVLETHRVYQILETGEHPVIRTKGDANATPDPWQMRLTKGPAWRVRMVVPQLGYSLMWWRLPLARTAAILAAPLLIAVLWIRDIWAPYRRDPEADHGRHNRHRPASSAG